MSCISQVLGLVFLGENVPFSTGPGHPPHFYFIIGIEKVKLTTLLS